MKRYPTFFVQGEIYAEGIRPTPHSMPDRPRTGSGPGWHGVGDAHVAYLVIVSWRMSSI